MLALLSFCNSEAQFSYETWHTLVSYYLVGLLKRFNYPCLWSCLPSKINLVGFTLLLGIQIVSFGLLVTVILCALPAFMFHISALFFFFRTCKLAQVLQFIVAIVCPKILLCIYDCCFRNLCLWTVKCCLICHAALNNNHKLNLIKPSCLSSLFYQLTLRRGYPSSGWYVYIHTYIDTHTLIRHSSFYTLLEMKNLGDPPVLVCRIWLLIFAGEVFPCIILFLLFISSRHFQFAFLLVFLRVIYVFICFGCQWWKEQGYFR